MSDKFWDSEEIDGKYMEVLVNGEDEEETISQHSTDLQSSLHSVKSQTSRISRRSNTTVENKSEITPLLSCQIEV